MSRYALLPTEFPQPPARMWQTAADLDRIAGEMDGGRSPAPTTWSGQCQTADAHREVAHQVRAYAVAGALAIDAVPSMPEGWVLAPHPLKIRQRGADDSGQACAAVVHFSAGLDLDASVAEFYRALDAAVRACPGSAAEQRAAGPAPSCLPCVRWADRHLSAVTAVG